MTGYHTRWVRPETEADDPERLAIREALAFGKALYDRRTALGLSVTDLAGRAGMTADEIECIEEGGTEPTVALLRRLAAALDATCASPLGTTSAPSWSKTPPPDPPPPAASASATASRLLRWQRGHRVVRPGLHLTRRQRHLHIPAPARGCG